MIGSLSKLFTVVSLSLSVLAKPVSQGKRSSVSRRDDFPSFNNFDGRSSLSNFDNFFGQNNFDGSNNEVVLIQEQQVVCQTVEVEVIQQRLTVLREFIKRILVEQVCEVETQTILLEQFSSGVQSFSRDIRRNSNRPPSFDSQISGMMHQLFNSDNSLTNSNLGFQGLDVGKNGVPSSGSNWNDASSPASVGKIWNAAQQATSDAQNQNSTQAAVTVSASSTATSTSTSTSASASATNTNSD